MTDKPKDREPTHDAFVACPSPYCSRRVPANIGDTELVCPHCSTKITVDGGLHFEVMST